jgi:hypothetical protein
VKLEAFIFGAVKLLFTLPWNPDEMAKRYLTLRDGTLGETPVTVMNFILAERAEA